MTRVSRARYFLRRFSSVATAMIISCLSISGCSELSPSETTKVQARSPEEAVAQLSESNRQTFMAWKNQSVKSCDPGEAFGIQNRSTGGRKDYEGVDGAALIRSNQNSLVFRDGSASSVLTDYDSFTGEGNSKVETTVSINGDTRTLSAETRRSGSSCELYLYGQKVYETKIFQNFTIGLEYHPGKQIGSISGEVQINRVGQAGYSITDGLPVLEFVNETVRPSKDASDFFARTLNLSKERAAELFKVGRPGVKIARIANEPSAIWSIADSRGLIAFQSVLEGYLKSNGRVLPLEVRLAIPQLKIGAVENTADQAFWKIALNLAIEADAKSTKLSLGALTDEGLRKFDKQEALLCAEKRVEAFNVSNTNQAVNLQPSVPFMFEPCRVIHPAVERVSYEAGVMKNLIPVLFKGVVPARFAQYGGWDAVLTKLASAALSDGKDLQAEFDPGGQTRIVPALAQHLGSLRHGLNRYTQMKRFEDRVMEAGYRWTFAGEQLPIGRIDEILRVLNETIGSFEVSTLQLLWDLSGQPNGFEEQVRFASQIDESYRQTALRAMELANDLGFNSFRSEVFNVILQRRVAITELNEWVSKLRAVKSEIEPFKNLGAQRDQLVSLSIKWLRSQELNRGQLRTVYKAVNQTARPFPESTRTLLNDLTKSYSANRQAVEFAVSIDREYETLAISTQALAKRAEYDRWGDSLISTILQKRPTLEQMKGWNEMWAAIAAFNQREAVRVKDEFGSTNEWNRKEIVETAIKETWSNTDFSALETIAEVARLKTSCERHKGMSSLANCAGRTLFSRQAGLLLDPAFDGRYSKFAREVFQVLSQFRDFDAYTLKNKVTSRFFGSWTPIWSKCGNPVFETKANGVTRLLKQIKSERETTKKWEIERQIDKAMEECP